MAKKILLVCSAGMSTSMLVKKMREVIAKENKDYEVDSLAMAQAKPVVDEWDVLLLGPQVSFALNDFKKLVTKGQKVTLIPPAVYAMAKGKEALTLAEENM